MPPEIEYKDYFDTRFNGLEKLIDEKFKPLSTHEDRIKSLETWRAGIVGGLMLISYILYYYLPK